MSAGGSASDHGQYYLNSNGRPATTAIMVHYRRVTRKEPTVMSISCERPQRLLERITISDRPVLLVSLPRNDAELARAAVDAGAEGLKVHINLHHAASGRSFGSWEQEGQVIADIIALGVPVGIVHGTADSMCTPDDLQGMAAAGLDFVDAYLSDMPAWMLDNSTDIQVMAAVGEHDMPPHGTPEGGGLLPLVRMSEASILGHEGYGRPLCVADLMSYAWLAEVLKPLPVIVPTQRAITPLEVTSLHNAGFRGILIGAIVTGSQPQTIVQATSEFRLALDRLC